MVEKVYTAEDQAKISYYVCGQGAPLFCVHGSGRNKEMWLKNGWLQELEKKYMVIAMDIRGFGKSSVFEEAKYYEINRILEDIKGIMKECKVDEISYLGHSYGATIGFQAIRAGLPIKKAVCASGSMGKYFFEEVCPGAYEEYKMLADIKTRQAFGELSEYSEDDIDFIKNENMAKFRALFEAWSQWKPVNVEDISGKASIYAGTLDHNKEMVENTTIRQAVFKKQGIDTKCFEGLNHEELVTRTDICLPWVLEHL
ncbi:MAG: hypothetical protein PWP24_536 [Clostridiales bacterium]|nr:hypothetical protein [Clostridiales bacterium]